MAKKGLLNQYLLQLQHHPLRTKVSLNKTTRIFVPFFFFFVCVCGYLGSFEVLVLLNFSFDPCLVAEKWRGNRRNMKVWIFSIVFLFWGFGIIWHERSAESGKMSNLIFLYYFCAETELYICIFNGYKLGFTFSLRLISVQFVI